MTKKLIGTLGALAIAASSVTFANAAVGIGQTWRLVGIYTMAAAYAGIAGGLLTQTSAFTSRKAIRSRV